MPIDWPRTVRGDFPGVLAVNTKHLCRRANQPLVAADWPYEVGTGTGKAIYGVKAGELSIGHDLSFICSMRKLQ
jgi:hypothetical protein